MWLVNAKGDVFQILFKQRHFFRQLDVLRKSRFVLLAKLDTLLFFLGNEFTLYPLHLLKRFLGCGNLGFNV